jgi:hypothetical protein
MRKQESFIWEFVVIVTVDIAQKIADFYNCLGSGGSSFWAMAPYNIDYATYSSETEE